MFKMFSCLKYSSVGGFLTLISLTPRAWMVRRIKDEATTGVRRAVFTKKYKQPPKLLHSARDQEFGLCYI